MSTVKPSRLVNCPICLRPVPWTSEQHFKPFCSERCKLIDLGEWAMEQKRIPGETTAGHAEDDNSRFQ